MPQWGSKRIRLLFIVMSYPHKSLKNLKFNQNRVVFLVTDVNMETKSSDIAEYIHDFAGAGLQPAPKVIYL